MLEEFIPQRTSAYISQYDLHIGEMTVRETLDFSARCQGVGSRAGKFFFKLQHNYELGLENWLCIDDMVSALKEIMMEVSKREKEAGIVPDPEIDTYMKVLYLYSENFPFLLWSLADFMIRGSRIFWIHHKYMAEEIN